jgi:hypothetical protein
MQTMLKLDDTPNLTHRNCGLSGAIESCVSISQRLSLVTFFGLVKESHIITIPSLLLFLNSCSLPSSTDLIITSLRCSPSAFDSFRTNTEIKYTLAKPASITIYIAQRDDSGQLVLVNTLAQNIYETKGSHGHTWLGDTAAGLFAESGLYIAILQIESNQYETSVRVFHF